MQRFSFCTRLVKCIFLAKGKTMQKIAIRPCAEADVPAVTAIYTHHVLHGAASFETVPPSLDDMCRRRSAVLEKDLPYLVAVQDDMIAGYAYAGTYRPRAAYRDTVENSVYLRHDMTGRGIGTRLLEALIEECEARDLRQMIAVIGDSANAASIRLHARCGFHHVGTLRSVGHKLGRWLDSVLMQRALRNGDSVPPRPRAG
jgi:L-amino acid N-acyltransferase YncA